MFYSKLVIKWLALSLGLCSLMMNSQNPNENDQHIFSAFKEFTKLPREISFTHLNKTTLIKGEDLGFTVYLFDKYLKKPSTTSTNVYCTLEDKSGQIIKSALILATDGVAANVFEIDSLFPSGNYIFKSYTNWMKNFDEENLFLQDIQIIDPEKQDASLKRTQASELDVQFLAEGGHLVDDISNTMGVIVKDAQGFGVKEVKGIIVDRDGTELTNFKTNSFGIAKFIITPKKNEIYKSILSIEDHNKELILPNSEPFGINMGLTDLGDQILLKLRTNDQTFQKIKNNSYKLSIHNGSQLKIIDVAFTEKKEASLLIDYKNLYSGINILTLFDSNDKPILERLFFNYTGISILDSTEAIVRNENDSIAISLPIHKINPNQLNNFSVSVLPHATQSYNNHQNIISQTYLKPYLKGYIENSGYYFTDIDREKKYNLDLLLLTQGWSSYDWNSIFNNPPTAKFEFETGINLVAKINRSMSKKFLIYPLNNSETLSIEVPANETSFAVKGLLPMTDERLAITSVDKRNKANRPNLYLQFTPSKIPSITNFTKIQPLKQQTYFESNSTEPLLYATGRKIEMLDEVVINAERKKEKIEKLKDRYQGTVDVLTDAMRESNMDFASYLSSKGFSVYQSGTNLTVKNLRRTTLQAGGSSPLIYLDNLLLSDFSILANYDMSQVDYVVIDKSGLGEGMRGANGVIKIFTSPQLIVNNSAVNNVSQIIEIPLTFRADKKFYVPLYPSYRNEFFEHFGVIDWFPKLKVDPKGHLNFKVAAKTIILRLFIEGIGNDGAYLSEIKTITIK